MRIAFVMTCAAAVAFAACEGSSSPQGEDTESTGGETEEGTTESPSPSTSSTATTPEHDTGTGDDPASTGSTTDEPEPGACGPGRACLGPPPLGWTGPVVVAKGALDDVLPACLVPTIGPEVFRFEGFTEPGATECSCSCAADASLCANMYFYLGTPSYCYDYYYPASEGCNPVTPPTADHTFLNAYSYVTFGATCNQNADETIPDVEWGAITKDCSIEYSMQESCDDTNRVCYKRPPPGFDSAICYYTEGDIPCPPNTDYAEKTTRYSSLEDTRDCTTCQCGMPSSCLTEYGYYTTSDCSGEPAGTVADNSCTNVGEIAAVEYDFSGLTCPVLSDSEPEGEATPREPWTYCCAPL